VQHTEDPSSPWHLLLQVGGREHEFRVEPEFRPSGHDHDLLVLRVVGASKARDLPMGHDEAKLRIARMSTTE
jgi:hypothetical protein